MTAIATFDSHVVVGVDPGKEGALALLQGSAVNLVPMPVIASCKARPEYDADALVALLERARPRLLVLEKLQTLPRAMGGGRTNFARGYGLALLEGIAAALRIPRRLVRPMEWQRVMHAGANGADTKQRSIVVAQRLFPGINLRRTPRATRLDDGLAEAALLAEFGRRELAGTQGAQ